MVFCCHRNAKEEFSVNSKAPLPTIEHVFVLMLENHSFDNMLGFSKLSGSNAVTGQPTTLNCLTGSETNSFRGIPYIVGQPAPAKMKVDPGHEFSDVLEQLCGAGAKYPPHGAYPPINNRGFVSNFATLPKFTKLASTPSPPGQGDIMQCFAQSQLPILNTLAEEFAVCDSWFCSMPGPTWPNRFFALAGSSAGLDHSPTPSETGIWQTISGFKFQNGSIFDRNIKWRIYAGNVLFTFAHALKRIHINNIRRFSNFASDINGATPQFDAQFTWIEPDYGHVLTDFTGGDSQHPLDGVVRGEILIKNIYEAIRHSPIWDTSLLIITWDEHGGFYDHVAPPAAIPPRDKPQFRSANQFGFDFNQYGPRVPAVVISPHTPRNIIDHRVYDHSSILATLERLFNLQPLTKRDAQANDVLALASLSEPRVDAPLVLPDAPKSEDGADNQALDALEVELQEATRGDDLIERERDNLPGFLYLVTRAYLQMSPMTRFLPILMRHARVRTRRDARDYFEEVRRALASARRLEAIR